MDEPRDCRTEWSKPKTERQIPYDVAYMLKRKKKDTNELVYITEIGRPTDRKKKKTYGYQRGKGEEG